MSSKFVGDFVLSVEEGTASGHPWYGTFSVPEDKSKGVAFELFSRNPIYSTEPFKEIESETGSVVRGWLNSNRPITLIEPYTFYTGGGEWSKGYRQSAAIRGRANNYFENEHFTGGDEGEISEVGFSSEALSLMCRSQSDRTGAKKSVNHPLETLLLENTVELKGLGNLTLKIAFKDDEDGKEVFARSFTRLVNPNRITVWQAIEFGRLQLTIMDFLAGKAEGDYHYGVLGRRDFDSSLRLKGRKRERLGEKLYESRTRDKSPISTLPQLISNVWHDENLKNQVFAATTLTGANLGLIEKFSRASAYLEQFLRSRYADAGLASRQNAYKAGIVEYQSFLKSGGENITDFANRFAKTTYPRGVTLRELFEMALQECKPLGLSIEENYERKLVRLRNEVFHGHEGNSVSWVRQVQFATEVVIAALELLIAKDIGLTPTQNYRPRHDTLGAQFGIYGD